MVGWDPISTSTRSADTVEAASREIGLTHQVIYCPLHPQVLAFSLETQILQHYTAKLYICLLMLSSLLHIFFGVFALPSTPSVQSSRCAPHLIIADSLPSCDEANPALLAT